MRAFRVVLCLLPFLFFCKLGAQVARTSLNGTVVDEQGKRIPSAKVKVANVATGLIREAETGSQGSYVLPEMETGTFTIEITKEGFTPFSRRNLRMEVGQPKTLDVILGVAEQ